MSKDYYKILEVDRGASQDEIKKSYRKLAKKYHPDKTKGDKDSEEKFKECAEAFEVLSDPDKKNKYDTFGHVGNGNGNGFPFEGFDMEDILNRFGGSFGFGGPRRKSQRGGDIKVRVSLTMKEIIEGAAKKIKYSRQHQCQTCSGKGGKDVTKCTACDGHGSRATSRQTPIGIVQQVMTCNVCGGEGEIIKDKCGTCHGSGVTPKEEVVDVSIPKGAMEGMYMTVPQHGNFSKNGIPGDLHVMIEEIPDPNFDRVDDDLQHIHSVSLVDSILGTKNNIMTPRGKVDISVRPGTQHGSVVRITGMGVPNINNNGRFGDLLVKINVKMPKSLNLEETTLLKKLKSMPNFK